MTERRLYLDVGIGESRGVVTLDGRPERLLISRQGDPPAQALGAIAVGRVRRLQRAQGLAFVDIGEGPDAVLNLAAETSGLHEGQAIEVEIRAEARGDKGASVRWLGPAEGDPRLLSAAPGLEARLAACAPGVEVQVGGVARTVADGAQDEALQTVFPLPGGGTIAVETTRALTAVDVDLGGRSGPGAKQVARLANVAALAAAARILRLKGLGGLIVVDLVGRGHDGPALLSAARGAFGPDNPGVAFGPVSRFGTIELTIPRRARPAVDVLADENGVASVMSCALALIRLLEREAAADRGGRFEARAAPEVAAAAQLLLPGLIERMGARLSIRADPARARPDIQVAAP